MTVDVDELAEGLSEFEQKKKEAHAALIQENINSPFKFKLRLLTKVEDNALEKHLKH